MMDSAKKDVAGGSELTEQPIDDSARLKPASEGNVLVKVFPESPATSKVSSEVVEKAEDLAEKSEASAESKGKKVDSEAAEKAEDLAEKSEASVESEVKKVDSEAAEKAEDLAKMSEASAESKVTPEVLDEVARRSSSRADGSEGSRPSSEEKSDSFGSAISVQSSDGKSTASFVSVRDPSGEESSDGHVCLSSCPSTSSSMVPSVGSASLDESLKALSLRSDCEDETPEEESERVLAVLPSEANEPGQEQESTEENQAVPSDGDPKTLSGSPVAEEEGGSCQKRKGAQSGSAKRFLGMYFGYKSSDKTKTPKKSSANDESKSPKKSDEPTEKTESSVKTDTPVESSDEKRPKNSNKSEGHEESSEKIKTPKKSKKSTDPNDVKSPKKIKSPRKSKTPDASDKSKASKKSGELEESKTDSPLRSNRKSFFQTVGSPINKILQRLSPGGAVQCEPPVPKRLCSSTVDPEYLIKSPQLSPISDGRHFSTSYFGNVSSEFSSDTDRIDYSKLAEEKIITTFLTSHLCYDVMPVSGKVIVLSVDLLVKNAFSALVTNEIKAAPLWDSGLHDFVGFLTITDFINVLRHYYYSSPEDIKDIENQSISTWRRITQLQNRFVKINGSNNLVEAVKLLLQEGVHRVPVFDERRQCVLFVLTQKRLLRFLNESLFKKLEQFNIKAPSFFKKTVREVGIGTFENIAIVSEDTKVITALDLFVERGISSLPVVDADGVLKDIFGKMDVFALAKEQLYDNLGLTVNQVIDKGTSRENAVICTLDECFGAVIQRFIYSKSHRVVVIDEMRFVVGIISLSDLMKFLVLEPLAAQEASAGCASDIIEEGAEGAVGGADGDSVFDNSENATGELGKDVSSTLNSMKTLNISEDNEAEPASEDVSKSE